MKIECSTSSLEKAIYSVLTESKKVNIEEDQFKGKHFNPKDYHVTSEKSQFGGHRPKIVHKDKKDTMYLGQASYTHPHEAEDHAKSYLRQYSMGQTDPDVPHKGTAKTYSLNHKNSEHSELYHDGKHIKTFKGKDASKKAISHMHKLTGYVKEDIEHDELEQIDELSKKTLGSYIKVASRKVISATKGAEKHGYTDDRGHDSKVFKKLQNRISGIDRATDKLTKEDIELTAEEVERLEAISSEFEDLEQIDEKRGRPAKEGSAAWKRQQSETSAQADEPRHHIIPQLQRAKVSMSGGTKVKFKDGSEHHIAGHHASKLLDKYMDLKPTQKIDFQKKIGASHDALKSEL